MQEHSQYHLNSTAWREWTRRFRVDAEAARSRELCGEMIQRLHYYGSLAHIPRERRAYLLHSLAIFQLGEAGEGRIAHEIDRVHFAGIDDDYRQALKYFVAEEGRHARMLAVLLKANGGTLLSRNWTDHLFARARRLLGVRFKLLVLFVAEIVGIVHYSIFARTMRPGVARNLLREIVRDERKHLAFHQAFLQRVFVPGSFRAVLARTTVLIVLCAASFVVSLEHRRTYRAFRIATGRVARLSLDLCARSLRATRVQEPLLPRRREERFFFLPGPGAGADSWI